MSHMFIAKQSDKRPRRVPSNLNADIVPPGVNVLVVDINRACLAVTEAKLLHFGYSVLTAGGVEEATSILEDKSNEVHLLLAEAYFPGMEPFEVLQKLGRKFDMAVVILSDNEDEYVMLEAISRGAYFYLVKPIAAYDVKNLWQFALAKKREECAAGWVGKDKSDGTAAGNVLEEDYNAKGKESRKGEETRGDLATKTGTGEPRGRKRGIEEEEGDGEVSTAEKRKKAKVAWTSALHERFLQAMKALGPEKAQPKKILQHMNMPGLRKEHISSHLQKFRLFLRKEEGETLKGSSFSDIMPASSSTGGIGPSLIRSSLVAEVTKAGRMALLDTQSSSRGSNSSITMNIPEINGESLPPNYRVPESFGYGRRIEHGGKTGLLGSCDLTNSTQKACDTRNGSRADVTVSGSGVSSAEPPLRAGSRASAQDAVKYDEIERGMMELEELVKLLNDSDDPDIN